MIDRIASWIMYAIMMYGPVAMARIVNEYFVAYELTVTDHIEIAEFVQSSDQNTIGETQILYSEYYPESERYHAVIAYGIGRRPDGLQIQELLTCNRFSEMDWSCTSRDRLMLVLDSDSDSMIEVVGSLPIPVTEIQEVVSAALIYASKHNIPGQPTEISWLADYYRYGVKFDSNTNSACEKTVLVAWHADTGNYQVPEKTSIQVRCI